VDAPTAKKLILTNKYIQVEKVAPQKITCMAFPAVIEIANNLSTDQIKTLLVKRATEVIKIIIKLQASQSHYL